MRHDVPEAAEPQDAGVEVLVDGDGAFTARELAQVVDVILKDGKN